MLNTIRNGAVVVAKTILGAGIIGLGCAIILAIVVYPKEAARFILGAAAITYIVRASYGFGDTIWTNVKDRLTYRRYNRFYGDK